MAPRKNKSAGKTRRNASQSGVYAPALVLPQNVNHTFTSSSTTTSISAPSIGSASDARLTSCQLQYAATDATTPTYFIFQLYSDSSTVQVETMPMIACVGFPKTIRLRMPRYVDRGSSPRLFITCSGAGIVTGYVNFTYRGTSSVSSTSSTKL